MIVLLVLGTSIVSFLSTIPSPAPAKVSWVREVVEETASTVEPHTEQKSFQTEPITTIIKRLFDMATTDPLGSLLFHILTHPFTDCNFDPQNSTSF
jgi:hypothetical protein